MNHPLVPKRPVLLFDVFKTLLVFDGDHIDENTFQHLATWLNYRQVSVSPIALQECYKSVTAEQIASAVGNSPDVDVLIVWDRVLANFCMDAVRRRTLIPELALVYRQITTHMIDVWPGTFDMLNACTGFRLAIASNTQRAYTEAELRMFGLWDYFEQVVFSSDVASCKPDSTIFFAALQALDITPDEVLYIGDNPYDDVLGASRLGIRTILLDRGTPTPAGVDLPSPLAIIADGDSTGVARVARQYFGFPS